MADINFPNSPSVGTTYDYQGIRYTWFEPSLGLGLWKATTPGSVGIATSAEITAGTDPIKYMTPLENKGAQLWQQGSLVTPSAAELNKLKNMTSNTGELNKLDGFLGDVADLNKIADISATASEVNARCDGVPLVYMGAEGSSQLASGQTWIANTWNAAQNITIGEMAVGDYFLINYIVSMSANSGVAGPIDLLLTNLTGSLGRTGFTGARDTNYIAGSGFGRMEGGFWLRCSNANANGTMSVKVNPLNTGGTQCSTRLTVARFKKIL